jgi:hypothetical protein
VTRERRLCARFATRRVPVGFSGPVPGNRTAVFFFFSNRLGCLGSLAVSAIVTLILLIAFDIL